MFVLKSLSIFVLLLSAPLSLSQRGSGAGTLDESSLVRKGKKEGRKNHPKPQKQKAKLGKNKSVKGNGENEVEEEEDDVGLPPGCQVEEVETILNQETGEFEEDISYTLDPTCVRVFSCEERSSDVLTCQKDSAGECVCEKACIALSTLSTTCSETPSGCVCTAAWIVSLFAHADTNGDKKLSQEELFDWHQQTSCVNSFVYKGKTYDNECTTEGPEDAIEKYPWCSTKVDNAGNHLKGFYKYCEKAGYDSEWEKFLNLDTNGDNMLSFDEMLPFEDDFSIQSVGSTEPSEGSTELLSLENQVKGGHVVNLAEDFPTNDLSNKSSGAMRVKKAFDNFNKRSGDDMLGVMVIENGINVAEFYNEKLGVTKDTKFYVWSVTKTVMGLLIGQMMKEHPEVSYNTALKDLHPKAREYCEKRSMLPPFKKYQVPCFHKQEDKKSITLKQLLTMTSGMHDCGNPLRTWGVHLLGGRTAWGALHATYFKEFNTNCKHHWVGGPRNTRWTGVCHKGQKSKCSKEGYHYIYASNILSYILKDRTGRGPEDYINTKLAPKLGLDKSDFEWCLTSYDNFEDCPLGGCEKIGTAFHGLKLTLPAMAKIGQFYLQGGKASEGEAEADMLTTKEYMDDVHYGNLVEKYVNKNSTYPNPPDCNLGESNVTSNYYCGNRHYDPNYYSNFVLVDPDKGNYCALGTSGKLICWTPRNNRVIAITHNKRDINMKCNLNVKKANDGGTSNEFVWSLYQYIDAGLDGDEPYDFTVAANPNP